MEYIFEKKIKIPTYLISMTVLSLFFALINQYVIFTLSAILTIGLVVYSVLIFLDSKHSTLILSKHTIKCASDEDSFEIPWKKVKFSNFSIINNEVTWIIGTDTNICSIHIENYDVDEIIKLSHMNLSENVFKDESIKLCGNYTLLL